MRDHSRIPEVLGLIQEFWMIYPDMRFNQLMDYIQYGLAEKNPDYFKKVLIDEIGWGTTEIKMPDLFYVEDDAFIIYLRELIDEEIIDKNNK